MMPTAPNFFERIKWRKLANALIKLVMLVAFYLAGYLSANKVAIDQSKQINLLRSETSRQQYEIDKFTESNELINRLTIQVDELTKAIDHLQQFHGNSSE